VEKVEADGVPDLVEAMDQGAVAVKVAAEAAALSPEQQREVVAQVRQGKPARQAVSERQAPPQATATSPGLARLLSAWRKATAEEQTAFVAAAWGELSPEKRAALVAAHADELAPLLADARRQGQVPRRLPSRRGEQVSGDVGERSAASRGRPLTQD
jgi:hypothetical protein